jgi:DNA-binding NarL/FixJ family response regulator
MNKLKVLIAGDQAIMRAGLRLLINSQPDMEVVADVSDATAAEQKVADATPNVVILDLSIPGSNVCKAIEAIRRIDPQTRVVVLSMHDDPVHAVAAISAGASGLVLKRSTDTDLLSAIRCVNRGESFIDPRIASSVIQRAVLKRAAAHTAEPGKARHILSQRERQVLELVVDGFTNQEVADRLFLSVKTVETHRSRLMRKLGLSSRADLIRYAREAGIGTREGPGQGEPSAT